MNHFWRKPGKTLIYLLSLFMTIGLLCIPVYAEPGNNPVPAEGGEEEQTEAISAASITAFLQTDAPEDLTDYLSIAEHKDDLVVDMYEVASFNENSFKTKEGKFTIPSGYDLNSEFTVTPTRDNSAELIAKWDELAQKLTGQVKNGTINPDVSQAKIGDKITSLEPGLYLILAYGKDLTGSDRFEEVQTQPTDPDETPETLITTVMNTYLYTYNFRPVLIVVPSKSADANQITKDEDKSIATSDEGKWIYDVNVYLKPSQKERLGNLRIIKRVETLEQRGTEITPMTAVFRITGWAEHTTDEEGNMSPKGDPFYHNVASITVPLNESVLIQGIPVGTYIEVEEIYTGSGYKFLEQNPASVIIETIPSDEGGEPSAVTFTFKNTYDDELKKGYGVQNSFNKEDGEWKWTNDLHGSQGGDE